MFGGMNPLQLMLMNAQMEQQQMAQQMGAAGMNPMMNSNSLGSMLGSVEGMEPHVSPLPGTVNPDFPRAMSPAFTQNIMQTLMQMSDPPSSIPSLGAVLAGRV